MRVHTSLLAAALCTGLLGVGGIASAQVSVSIRIAPPALPIYVQPAIPAAGYLWVPGYWSWSDEGYYYWVPGTWVLPPETGLLWTPGYWGWSDGAYLWHEGYWSPHVGFYGGVDYGFGYGPNGYDGGHWDHGQFYYNTAVNRIPSGVHLAHVYRHPMEGGGPASRVSFNGGQGGVHERPTAAQLSAGHETHVMPIAAQRQLIQSASHNRQLRADYNHGHPGIAATPRPSAFTGAGGEAAHAPAREERHSEGGAPAATIHRGPGPARSRALAPPNPEQRAVHEPSREASPAPHPAAHAAPHVTPHANPPHPVGPPHAAEQRGGGGKTDEHRDQHPPR